MLKSGDFATRPDPLITFCKKTDSVRNLPPLVNLGEETESARFLPQVLALRSSPPPSLTFADIHKITGEPKAARAAIEAAEQSASWIDVGAAYYEARTSSVLADSSSAWRGYCRTCEADGLEPTPVTLSKMLACWTERVVGRHLKSSALKSVTSRILTHAQTAGHPTPPAVAKAIRRELVGFCTTFPCEVRAAAPPLGIADGLDTVIAYASERAADSLFFRCMAALLHMSQALYCRPTAIINGRLRRRDVLYLPSSATVQGGIVVSLKLPKRRKDRVDDRLDAHPIPTGPAVLAILSWLAALDMLSAEAPPEGIIFPDIDPETDKIRAPSLSVKRASAVLRRYVFSPAGIPNGRRVTLRSIRSGSSTDAAIAGVPDSDRCAQGGWRNTAGAKTYLDRALAVLSLPSSTR